MTLEEDDVYEELEGLIGKDAADRLVEYFAGSNIYIPKRIINEKRRQQIRDEFKNGKSYYELAMEYRYTETHIRRVVHKMRPKGSPTKTSIKRAKAT